MHHWLSQQHICKQNCCYTLGYCRPVSPL